MTVIIAPISSEVETGCKMFCRTARNSERVWTKRSEQNSTAGAIARKRSATRSCMKNSSGETEKELVGCAMRTGQTVHAMHPPKGFLCLYLCLITLPSSLFFRRQNDLMDLQYAGAGEH